MGVTKSPKSTAEEVKSRSTGQSRQSLWLGRRRRAMGTWAMTSLAVLALVLLVAWASDSLGLNSSQAVAMQTYEVKRAVLDIMVVEQGNLESAQNVEIKCEVEGGRVGSGTSSGGSGTQIIWVFPEGELARKGDKLVELDRSGLEEQELQQRILYETALQEKITAENTYEAAKIAVDEYQYGIFENERELIEGEITVAQENLRRAQQYLIYSEQMYQKGYVNQLQLEADQFAVENARLMLGAAETRKKTLVEYTKAKMLQELQGLRDSAQAAMKAAEAKFALEQGKLEKIRDQLTKCTIYAPQEGMVIHHNEQSRYRSTPTLQVEEGAVIRFLQTIIKLPDLTQMQVKANVHESMIERVKQGQKVNIRVDALPDLRLHGVVEKISNQPEQTSWFQSNVREYGVNIKITEKVENLKPGMTAEAEILVGQLPDVLTVPVQTVVEMEEKPYCYISVDGGVEKRPVVPGASNDVFIEIKDGLNEGERVVLNPRAVVPDAEQYRPQSSSLGKKAKESRRPGREKKARPKLQDSAETEEPNQQKRT